MKTWQDPYSYPEKEQPLLDSKNDQMAEVVLPEDTLYFLNLNFLAIINRKKQEKSKESKEMLGKC